MKNLWLAAPLTTMLIISAYTAPAFANGATDGSGLGSRDPGPVRL
jgi:hypothetical protein